MASVIAHERDQDDADAERYAKRTKINDPIDSLLPPSIALLGIPTDPTQPYRFSEPLVGISEYIDHNIPQIHGIIKQRFTDFLVHEVDREGNTIHVQEIGKPESPAKPETKPPEVPEASASTEPTGWTDECATKLSSFLPPETITQIQELYLEGPLSQDNAGHVDSDSRGRGRGRGRGGRGGRGRGKARGPVDTRKVLTPPMADKDTRTAFHATIRELFSGALDSETDSTSNSAQTGSQIAVKWAGNSRRRRDDRDGPRPPQYIHFSLQKTNRDTQDALAYLCRMLHVTSKDLNVAGTKDKRGVTVQRVSLRRKNKSLEDVWNMVNGLNGRRSIDQAMKQRGERGVRIADLSYNKANLELGMLSGNHFLITLRNVSAESPDTIDKALGTLKAKGFINYYGMQRFGTATVPTHSIGLSLLKSNWQRTIDLILHPRVGEQPEITEARKLWLQEHNLDRALEIMPRRVVAERCILEHYKKQNGDTRDALGALNSIPKTLRLMYIHAYQSYVWNAIVSERIRVGGADKPIVGDLVVVFGEAVQDLEEGVESKGKNSAGAPKVKTLTEADLDKHTIFDVVMPLPGTDVAYPGGALGEKYRKYLEIDGLDPYNFARKQKHYTLSGAYRKILHLPKDLSWTTLRYTDPDAPLAQADEDKILGFDPPPATPDGKFLALQVKLTLGTAAYATMALREITKMDTSTQHQIDLTSSAPDQKERDAIPSGEDDDVEMGIENEVENT